MRRATNQGCGLSKGMAMMSLENEINVRTGKAKSLVTKCAATVTLPCLMPADFAVVGPAGPPPHTSFTFTVLPHSFMTFADK
jgi:hypothetical protein